MFDQSLIELYSFSLYKRDIGVYMKISFFLKVALNILTFLWAID